MKKTLAAVLAAAMALSTATVALAVDDPDLDHKLTDGKGDDPSTEIVYGKGQDYTLNKIGDFTESELGYLYDNGYIDIKAIMVEGSDKLTGRPSFSLKKVSGVGQGTQTSTDVTRWSSTLKIKDKKGNNRTVYKEGEAVKKLPVYWDTEAEIWRSAEDCNTAGYYFEDIEWLEETGEEAAAYTTILNHVKDTNRVNTSPDLGHNNLSSYKVVRMSFTVADTYKTSSTNVKMKIRVTIKKNYTDADGDVIYKKGDTYTTDVISFKAKYLPVAAYAEDMQVTTTEVGNRQVILEGGKVYDEVGNGKFRVAFGDDVALFEGKGSTSQKDVNLFYNLDEDAELTAMYPEVDFEFIEFKGTPTFVNSGSLFFKAENKNYTVYEWDGEGWNPISNPANFEPTYKTIEVKNIKKLTKYAVASDVLEVEEEPEEPAEPVDSAPSVEDNKDEEGGNPNTGAC